MPGTFDIARTPAHKVQKYPGACDILVQRCSCGSTPGPTGECAECRRKRLLQPKLIVNQPGDIYEQEADRVADLIMRMTESDAHQAPTGTGVRAPHRRTHPPLSVARMQVMRADAGPGEQPYCTGDPFLDMPAVREAIHTAWQKTQTCAAEQEEQFKTDESMREGAAVPLGPSERETHFRVENNQPTAVLCSEFTEKVLFKEAGITSSTQAFFHTHPNKTKVREADMRADAQIAAEVTIPLYIIAADEVYVLNAPTRKKRWPRANLDRPCEQPAQEETAPVMRKMNTTGDGATNALPTAHISSLQGAGHPMPAAERAFFEPRFGYDFSRVRVHTDAQAAASAQAVQARAYTVGHNVVFGSGQYAPGTPSGRRLLAHELTHVVQQTGGVARGAGSVTAGTSYKPDTAQATKQVGPPVGTRDSPWGSVSSCRSLVVQRQHGTKGASSCAVPADCPSDFCTPFPSVADAQDDRDWWWPLLRGGIAKAVDSRVVPLWEQHAWGGAKPQDLSSTFAGDFTSSKTTKAVNRDIHASIILKLKASPPTFPHMKNRVTVSVGSIIPGHIRALSDAKNALRMNFDVIGEIPGNIAGDIGKDQLACKVGANPSPFNDDRTLKGDLVIDLDPATNELTVTPKLRYVVKDTIDLCPGNCGAFKEQLATVSLSRWEASGISGDVPFTVEFDAAMAPFKLILSGPPPRKKPPSPPKKKGPPVEICEAKEGAPVVVATATPGKDRIVKLSRGTRVEVLKKIPSRLADGTPTVWYRVKMLGGAEPGTIGQVQKKYLEKCQTTP